MDYFRKTFLALKLWAGLFLMCPSAVAHQPVVLVSDPFPPYVIVSGGEITGIAVDIIREAFHRTGKKLEISIMPWKRALRASQTGKVDGIFTFYYNEERAQTYYFSEVVQGYSTQVLMARTGSQIGFDGDIESIKGETIGVSLGYNVGTNLENAFKAGLVKRQNAPNSSLVLKMLLNSRFNLISNNREVLLFLAKNSGVLDRVSILAPPLSTTPFYIGYSKALSTSLALRRNVDVVLRQMWEDGSIKKFI